MILNTLRGKLTFYFCILLVILIVSYLFSFNSGLKISREDDVILFQMNTLNKIYLELEQSRYNMTAYLQNDNQKLLDQFNKSSLLLTKLCLIFENHPREVRSKRFAIDLTYQIQTYLEMVQKSLHYHQSGERELSTKFYSAALHLNELIQGNYKNLFQVVISDLEKVRKNSGFITRNGIFINLLILLFIIIIGAIFIVYISRMISRPVVHLTKASIAISEGEWDTQIESIKTHDELEDLTNSIKTMVSTMKSQYEDLKQNSILEKRHLKDEIKLQKMDTLVKETQLKALQAQVNPHFLFNTLNMISQTAYIEKSEKTSNLIEALSSFLRYNLDYSNRIVILSKEIDNLNNYLYIQKLRTGERILVELDWDNKSTNSKLPSLILQPLVENAYIHGVRDSLSNGLIKISVMTEMNQICIRISDNGVGIPPGKMESVRHILTSTEIEEPLVDTSNSIGLINVVRRLKLYFNNEQKITLNSISGKGTEISFKFPVKD